MNVDARISVALPSHPKTKKLIRRAGQGAAWNLVCLFLWVSQNKPSGDLSGLSEEDIEIAAGWEGDEGKFVQLLCEVRFLDGEPGAYEVHDWAEHNPWASGAERRSEKSRAAARARWGIAEEQPPAPAEDAPSMPAACPPHANSNAQPLNGQCPVSVSVSDSISVTETKNLGAVAPPPPRGTRLPKDWILSDDWRREAETARREAGLPPIDLAVEASRFRDHWHSQPGQKGVKLEWLATWRNWARNSWGGAAKAATPSRLVTPAAGSDYGRL